MLSELEMQVDVQGLKVYNTSVLSYFVYKNTVVIYRCIWEKTAVYRGINNFTGSQA